MWIVLDSNIYISAALSVQGHSRSILKLAEEGKIEVSITDALHDEVESILKEKLRWPAEKADLWISYLRSFTHLVRPQERIHDCTDTDDNHILECAVEAHAEIIVTGDNHLLKLHPYREIAILTPRQFLETKPWQSGRAA